jgi:4-alpha-glucanotransferase
MSSSSRSSGVLLHPTSLPGPHGIGDLGRTAVDFIDRLAAGGQRLWQILPLGPTGYGNSPYQGLSAFAGNPLLISLDTLAEQGLLTATEASKQPAFNVGPVDFPAVIAHRKALWPRVLDRFEASAATPARGRFEEFCRSQADWLNDFALFMAVKTAHDEVAWTNWGPDIAHRDPTAVARWSRQCAVEIRMHKLTQFLFFEQWQRVHEACRARGIAIIGDIPLFVAHDSADVWARRDLFRLDDDGNPTVVAGVPPDYFSATGQLWGNPHYRWDVLKQTGFAWWIERFRATLALVDRVRIDHFRGFQAAWEIPSAAVTAVQGHWVDGPGARLFEALRSALHLDRLPLVAENLGVITAEVETLRQRFGLPGMAILQFAFGTDPQAPDFRPHNYERNQVAYTGTHDNDTTMGWWSGEGGHSTRSAEDIRSEREQARRYLALGERAVHWEFIRAVLASVAGTAIFPAQDLLGLGTDARMNRPGTLEGNWQWRLLPGQLTPEIVARLAEMTRTYERI